MESDHRVRVARRCFSAALFADGVDAMSFSPIYLPDVQEPVGARPPVWGAAVLHLEAGQAIINIKLADSVNKRNREGAVESCFPGE